MGQWGEASPRSTTRAAHFDPAKFKDRYETALNALVKRKAAGKKIEPAEPPNPARQGERAPGARGQRSTRRESFAQSHAGPIPFILHKLDARPFKHAPNLREIMRLGHTDAGLIVRNQRCRNDGNLGEFSLG